nr:uncharacterized protein LOC117279927 [Nicotiana tomentosiformis]
MVKNANGTIIPMILAEIYRALIACRAGTKFFEGCNLLLQMWLVEHLCHRPGYMNYGLTGLNCIEEYENRVNGHELPEGTKAWYAYLGSLNANRIEWTFGWLSVDEVIYMSAGVCFLLLMALRSIQPYAPHRVLRQLGRYQTVPYDEDLSPQVIELCPKATFPEERVRQIWHQCRFLEPQTQVRDLSIGEVGSNYDIWYGKRSRVDQEPEQPAKRPHVQQFTDGAREQWVWLAKEKEYRTTINKLEEQIEKIKFDSSLQAAEDEGEKKRLARENEALRAQIQRMKIAAETPVRSERDEKIITNLRRKVHDYGFDLTKAEEHARLAHQLKQKYDKEVAIL